VGGWAPFPLLLLLATLGWALVRAGATLPWDLFRLFPFLCLAFLVAAWSWPTSGWPTSGWRVLGLVVYAAVGAVLLGGVVALPPLRAHGFVLAASGWIVLGVCRWAVAVEPRWGWRIAVALVAVGTAEAAVGVGRVVADGGVATGTLRNANHFAGLLAMTVGLAVGLAWGLRGEGARRRWWRLGLVAVLASASVMAVAIVLSGSRGALAAVALAALGVLVVARFGGRERVPLLPWAAAVLALTAGLGWGIGKAFEDWKGSGLERRVLLYADTVELIADHPWLGVGAGTYRWHFRPYQRFDVRKRFDHAHDEYLETAAEWGIPAAAGFFLFCGHRLLRSARRFLRPGPAWRRGLGLGCAAAITALLAHALVDFDLRTPANLVVFAGVLGVSWGLDAAPGRSPGRVVGWLRGLRRGLLRGLIPLLVLAAGVRVGWLTVSAAGAARGVRAADAAALGDFPWAPFHLRLGLRLWGDPEHRDPASARAALERAVALNPHSWRYRMELGQFYEGVGRPDLAADAYRQALARNPRSPRDLYRVAGFHLRHGEPRRALPLLRRAVVAEPALGGSAADLLLASAMTPAELARWWPRSPELRRPLVAALCLHRQRHGPGSVPEGLLDAAWHRYLEPHPGTPPPDLAAHDVYLRHRLRMGELGAARRGWVELAAAAGRADPDFAAGRERVWNGGFDDPLAGGELGWQLPARSPSAARVAAEGAEGYALRLDFDGDDFRRLRQRVIVDPGRYELTFRTRSEALEAPRGVHLQLFDPVTRRVLWSGPELRGTTPWRRHAAELELDAGGVLLLRTGARPGAAGERGVRGSGVRGSGVRGSGVRGSGVRGSGVRGRRVRGRLWLDSISLRPLAENP